MSRPNIFRIIFGLFVLSLAPMLHASDFVDYDFSRFSQQVTECDRLASHGRDPGHVAPPVSRDEMDKAAAIIACTKAVKADPENPRLNYQLGRAYGYSDRGEEAMPYRLKAVDQDYPQSLFVIGFLYLNGQTIEKDTCKAMELWQRAARYRRLAALVSLPRDYMRGTFDSCDREIARQKLEQYLTEAKSITTDYYQSMLIDDLLAELEQP